MPFRSLSLLVYNQLSIFCTHIKLQGPNQSGLKSVQSAETALVENTYKNPHMLQTPYW